MSCVQNNNEPQSAASSVCVSTQSTLSVHTIGSVASHNAAFAGCSCQRVSRLCVSSLLTSASHPQPVSSVWAPATASRLRSLSSPSPRCSPLRPTRRDPPLSHPTHSTNSTAYTQTPSQPTTSSSSRTTASSTSSSSRAQPSQPAVRVLDRRDFIVSKRCDETVVRQPGAAVRPVVHGGGMQELRRLPARPLGCSHHRPV